MLAKQIHKIVILGAGRLATHLGLAFHKLGLDVVQVYNRTPENGLKLAGRIGASFTDDIQGITKTCDLYILAVSDSVLGEIASKLRLKNKLIVHTSGTVGMEVLDPISSSTGVFYPVQTFSPNRKIEFRKIPVCIEGNSKAVQGQLTLFAQKLTRNVRVLGSDDRRILHLGAVFAANFTNFMYAVTEELLRTHGMPLDLLEPLILQTARNVRHGNLLRCQTGPAARGDIKVIDKHRELLSGYPDYLEIYNLITNSIIKQKSLHGKL